MDWLYVGSKGCGKTLNAIDVALGYFASGSYVTTNIGLNMAEVKRLCVKRWGIEPDESQYIRLDDTNTSEAHKFCVPSKNPDGTWLTGYTRENLLIIDECNIFFPARGYADTAKKAAVFLAWQVQARKLGIDIIFIIQHPNNMDVTIKRQCEFEVKFRDLRHYPIPVIGIKPLAWIHMIAAGTFETGATEPMDRRVFMVDTDLYKLYCTGEMKQVFDMMTPPARLLKKRLSFAHYWEKYRNIALIFFVSLTVVGCRVAERDQFDKLSRDAQKLINALEVERAALSNTNHRGSGTSVTNAPPPRVITGYATINRNSAALACCLNGQWIRPGQVTPDGVFLTYVEERNVCLYDLNGKMVYK